MNPTTQQIKEARLSAGLTQSQSAALVHMTTNGWQHAEYGRRKIDAARWELFLIKTDQHTVYGPLA